MTILDVMVEYCNNIFDGKIPACQKHKWACQRFINDLANPNSLWVFDVEKAQKYIDWMGLFKHNKGALEGQYKIPVPYEIFVYGNIYGWKHKETGRRRFRRSYEQLAKKNAKSQDKAIQALYEMSAFSGKNVECYVAATQRSQTRHVWGTADQIYPKSDLLKDKFVTKHDREFLQQVIKHVKTGSVFARLSKEDKQKGDGINPQFMVLDEYHLHETTEYYDNGTSAMKTMPEPLLSIITTAGFELNNPCYRVEYDFAEKLLNPDNPVEDERYFAIICEMEVDVENPSNSDDITDESLWVKANPIIGDSPEVIEAIRQEVKDAQNKPEKLRDVKTKTFNIWVNERAAGYMNLGKWKLCEATESRKFPDVTGMTVFPGMDLSETMDLTSVSFDIPLGNDEYAIMSHSFMPKEKLDEKRNIDKVPYDLWIQQGYLTATPGFQVNYQTVLDYILEMFNIYKWPKGIFCYDRALAGWLANKLDEHGFIPVDVPQSYTGLSEATKDFRGKTYDKKIIYEKNPVLTWAVGNAVLREGPSKNIMLDKSKAKQKIDPIASVITAHTQAMISDSAKGNVYNERPVGEKIFVI